MIYLARQLGNVLGAMLWAILTMLEVATTAGAIEPVEYNHVFLAVVFFTMLFGWLSKGRG